VRNYYLLATSYQLGKGIWQHEPLGKDS